MTKPELIEKIAGKTQQTKKDAEAFVNAFTEAVIEALEAGEEVALIGFGTFSVKDKPEREGINPATGAKITIAASKAPAFKPGKAFKDALNK